ncbi:hypothetical protein AC578_5636 [Pseudocercospora eumusae]|uniref:RRM domain-containing protein n=1 Tax=Pseudocercospora eumusae TaxID=321146 RepID=A0A139HTB7_9PEZI|nr:hypothetical protein AC578_5636 [Pseudocercospora eumusae]
MSTFDGVVAEFPDIRIDRFRHDPNRPALAHFLSHVHSDHLVGLESRNAVPLYCSPATRELVLRLEKYPNRMNFAKGILESRKQTYKHLRTLLRPIPLDTPTDITLSPDNTIRVTLFDANHCVGAVMFLIEGNGKAILYTGDIRAEQWWVNSICRQPLLLPYVCSGNSKPLRQLDNIYLDTTFASNVDRYRHFPSKAEGIRELLEKVNKYPRDTEFYLDAWTFGYEDVWKALSAFLDSQIHVDDYKYGIYRALHSGVEPKAVEAYQLIGSTCGNHDQAGCLTDRYCRIHSCEKGTGCGIWNKGKYQGADMLEPGAGGGEGDLNQQHEIDLSEGLFDLIALCAQKLSTQPQLLNSLLQMLNEASSGDRHAITIALSDISIEASTLGDQQECAALADLDEMPIDRLVLMLAKRVTKMKQTGALGTSKPPPKSELRSKDGLPKRITFPYSRHSSYEELHLLIDAFKPRNIHPCTVSRDWDIEQSMAHLFGGIYSKPQIFAHDQLMIRQRNENLDAAEPASSSQQHDFQEQETQPSQDPPSTPPRILQSAFERSPSLTRQSSRSKRGLDEQEMDHAKRTRNSTYGEYWPPQERDLYSPESREVFVANLAADTTEHDLRQLFQGFATEEVRIPTQFQSAVAFATFASSGEAQRAVNELGGRILRGRRLRLEIARPPKAGYSNSSPSLPAKQWQPPSQITNELSSPGHQRSRWEQRIAIGHDRETHSPSKASKINEKGNRRTSFRDGNVKSAQKSHRQAPDYGRLSPPSPSEEDFVELTGDDLKEALQHEAYNAVLSGKGWCLVSVDGHQMKEEEL